MLQYKFGKKFYFEIPHKMPPVIVNVNPQSKNIKFLLPLTSLYNKIP
jgi:hypothetical protein